MQTHMLELQNHQTYDIIINIIYHNNIHFNFADHDIRYSGELDFYTERSKREVYNTLIWGFCRNNGFQKEYKNRPDVPQGYGVIRSQLSQCSHLS